MTNKRFGSFVAGLLLLGLTTCKNKSTYKPDDNSLMKGSGDIKGVVNDPSEVRVPGVKKSDPGATKILDEAIAAHGGLTALKQTYAALFQQRRGVSKGVPSKRKIHWQAPDRWVVEDLNTGRIHALLGEDCFNRVDELVLACAPREAEFRRLQRTFLQWSMLYPLKSKGVLLGSSPSTKVGDREAVGINATSADGRVKATVYFDKQSHLLVRIAYRTQVTKRGPQPSSGQRADATLVTVATDTKAYKTLGAVRIPSRVVTTANGQVIMTEEVVTISAGTVSPRLFTHPKQVSFGKVWVRQRPEMLVAFAAAKGNAGVKDGWNNLVRWVGQNRLTPRTPPIMVLSEPPTGVVAVMFGLQPLQRRPPPGRGVGLKKMAATTIVRSYGQGPYDQVKDKFAKLKEWIQKNGYQISGAPMQVLHGNPAGNQPDQLIYEIYYTVTKRK